MTINDYITIIKVACMNTNHFLLEHGCVNNPTATATIISMMITRSPVTTVDMTVTELFCTGPTEVGLTSAL